MSSLTSLRLDQSTFRLGKRLVHLTENLAALHQDLTFLRRCKRKKLIPNFISHQISFAHGSNPSGLLQHQLELMRHRLLTHRIRTKYSGIALTKSQIQDAESQLDDPIKRQLEPIIEATRLDTKRRKKFSLKAKFNRLKQQQEQLERKCFSKQNPSERVTVLDNIEVSPPAILALAKGPKFTLSPKVSREDLQHRVQIETAALAYALRWNAVIGSSAPPSQTIDAFQDLKSPAHLITKGKSHQGHIQPRRRQSKDCKWIYND